MICICLVSLVLIALYIVIIGPYINLLRIKMKLGTKAHFYFFPLLGWYHKRMQSTKLYGDELEITKRVVKTNPEVKIILSNFGFKPFLIFLDPIQYKQLYVDHQLYAKYDCLGHNQMLHLGLLMQEGTKWKKQRGLLGIPFQYEKLKAMIPMINQVVIEKCDTISKEHLLDFNVSITGEIIIRSFFGEEAKGLQLNGVEAQVEISRLFQDIGLLQVQNPYILMKQMLFGQKSWKIFPTRLETQLDSRVQALRLAAEKIIQQRIMNIKLLEQSKDQQDFLDIYLTEYLKQEQGDNTITIDEIIQQFITFFFAGTDTTAHQITICCYFLGQYPEIQQELLEEVIQVMGDRQNVTDQDIPKLDRMSAFIHEVMRHKNTAFSIIPRKVKQTHMIKDVKVEQGWFVQTGNCMPGYMSEYVDNPEEFDYKRWLNQANPFKNDNGYAFVPFSAGPRNCIGQHLAMIEMKIALCHLIRKYQLSIDPSIKSCWQVKFLYSIEPDTMIRFKDRAQ